jgi:hypothetical protein
MRPIRIEALRAARTATNPSVRLNLAFVLISDIIVRMRSL